MEHRTTFWVQIVRFHELECRRCSRTYSAHVASVKRLQYALNRASGEVNGEFYEKRSLNLIGSV